MWCARLHKLRRKGENCHSARRVCPKNPSWSFVFNREGFFASLRMTTRLPFPQPVQSDHALESTSAPTLSGRYKDFSAVVAAVVGEAPKKPAQCF